MKGPTSHPNWLANRAHLMGVRVQGQSLVTELCPVSVGCIQALPPITALPRWFHSHGYTLSWQLNKFPRKENQSSSFQLTNLGTLQTSFKFPTNWRSAGGLTLAAWQRQNPIPHFPDRLIHHDINLTRAICQPELPTAPAYPAGSRPAARAASSHRWHWWRGTRTALGHAGPPSSLAGSPWRGCCAFGRSAAVPLLQQTPQLVCCFSAFSSHHWCIYKFNISCRPQRAISHHEIQPSSC